MSAIFETSTLTLLETIREYILENGPVSFCKFMEMALYTPETGYYNSDKTRIGTTGDYFTSPNITPVLGEMLGKQLLEMRAFIKEKDFAIVEYGAGDGTLCRDILNYLKKNKEVYDNLTYYIIEKSSSAREVEKRLLNGKVRWIGSIQEIAPFTGCVISNEVVDNFAVHKVVMKDKLMEVYVNYEDGFVEFLKPAPRILNEYFKELSITLPKGFCTEVNMEATEWLKEIAFALERGYVMTIDYGYPAYELYFGNRRFGTLACYFKHRINDSPYSNIGKQDITAHVNFSALCHWGLKYGLDYTGFTRQSYFLLSMGVNNYLRQIEENSRHKHLDSGQMEFFLNTFIADMGSKLKMLILQKGLPPLKLSGMKFSVKKL